MAGRYPFPSSPNGWFAIAFSKELAEASLLTRRAFGRELVLFRREDGAPAILDAICPHMGAHLGHGGCVDRGAVRCPFHGLRFDGEGACVSLPHGGKPPKAKAQSFKALERNGIVFAWHHASGAAPTWEPPVLAGGDWSDLETATLAIKTHVQETAENSVDLAHFSQVHGYENVGIVRECALDGPHLTTALKATRSLASVGMDGHVSFVFDIDVWGLGCSIVNVDVQTFGIASRQIVLATPVDDETCELRLAAQVKKLPDDGATAHMLAMLWQGFTQDVNQDIPIWENKRYFEKPALTVEDGPISMYRKWVTQFY
jgi:3-ketosteroid 9alpha-monooxygenase subunit A